MKGNKVSSRVKRVLNRGKLNKNGKGGKGRAEVGRKVEGERDTDYR